MKPLFYILLLFACFPIVAKARQSNCFYHHNGRYKIIDSAHNSMILIERKDSAETQYLFKNGDTSQYDMKLVFKVEWLNDCTYKQYLVYNIIHTRKGDKSLPTEGRILVNKIMDADNNSYLVYTTFSNKKNLKYANRLWKLK